MERLSCICCVLVLLAGCGDDGSDSSGGKEGAAGEGIPKVNEMPDASMSETSEDSSTPDIETGLDCMGTCELMVGPMCEKGPPSVGLCVILCDSTLKGDNEMCREAFQNVLDCLDPTVEVSCDDEGKIVVSRCQDEIDALDPCLPSL